MGTYPETIPDAYTIHRDLKSAYSQGWNHGHGNACHCVPSLGDRISPEVDHDGLGRTVDEDNIRRYHELLCFHRAAESRPEYPEMDEDEEGPTADECMEAFSQGETDAIFADLATYTPADYGLKNDPPSPFCDDDWDGNDDHIDALKEALSKALAMIRSLRKAYGNLHDGLSDLVEGGTAHARSAMTPEMVKLIADQLAECVRTDQEAKDLLNGIIEE